MIQNQNLTFSGFILYRHSGQVVFMTLRHFIEQRSRNGYFHQGEWPSQNYCKRSKTNETLISWSNATKNVIKCITFVILWDDNKIMTIASERMVGHYHFIYFNKSSHENCAHRKCLLFHCCVSSFPDLEATKWQKLANILRVFSHIVLCHFQEKGIGGARVGQKSDIQQIEICQYLNRLSNETSQTYSSL